MCQGFQTHRVGVSGVSNTHSWCAGIFKHTQSDMPMSLIFKHRESWRVRGFQTQSWRVRGFQTQIEKACQGFSNTQRVSVSGGFKHRVRRHVGGTQSEKVCQGFSNTESEGMLRVFKHRVKACYGFSNTESWCVADFPTQRESEWGFQTHTVSVSGVLKHSRQDRVFQTQRVSVSRVFKHLSLIHI